ncbi:MAG: metallophosphoesterase family protein [Candidatus Margulisiibacteriota bacterium]
MTYVIGDVHGAYQKLRALLKYIPLGEKLVFIGDYINKGQAVKQTIDFLLDLSQKRDCVFLIGNHEFKLLQAWKGHQQAIDYLEQYGFKETLESYLGNKLTKKEYKQIMDTSRFKNILAQHYTFFKKLKDYYYERGILVVHAGVPLDENGKYCLDSLERMLFVRQEFINCKRKYKQKTIIFGHTAFKNVFWDGYKLGIDTGAVYNKKNGYGRLTAVNLDDLECVDNEGNRSNPINNKRSSPLLDKGDWRELL